MPLTVLVQNADDCAKYTRNPDAMISSMPSPLTESGDGVSAQVDNGPFQIGVANNIQFWT
jgi:hypothetical protein